MTLEDPFYVVKDEVFKALNKTRGLYIRWQELAAAATPPHSPEAEWTSTELKNALRSIQWDLEDLEDTISIVEKNSSKFKIDNKEITERRKFIDNTQKEVKMMRAAVAKHGVYAGTSAPWHAVMEWRAMDGSPSPPETPEQRRPNNQWLPVFDELAAEDERAALQASSGLKHGSLTVSDETNEHQNLIGQHSGDTEETRPRFQPASLQIARFLTAPGSRQRWVILGLLLLLVLVGILFVVV